MQMRGRVGAASAAAAPVPDIYLRNDQLEAEAAALRTELERMRAIAE